MTVTNKNNLSLTLAVWAVNDEYDYVSDPNYISVTTLMKPLRQIILGRRIKREDQEPLDVEDLISSAWGTALHNSIEHAWVNKYQVNLKKLGYPKSAIDRILINPEKDQIKPDSVCLYFEKRSTVQIGNWNLGGKFDLVAEGHLEDNKSTTAFTWLYGGKDNDYILQGSIYRYLNQDIVFEDFIRINFLFTDWKRMDAKSNPNYPQSRLLSKDYELMSLRETEDWIKNKLNLIDRYKDADEKDLPFCTDEELWRSPPKFKYYADPEKALAGGRSTKNFDTKIEADQFHLVEKQGKGVVVTVPGAVKRCGYCPAFNLCTQKDQYEHDN